MAVPRFWREIPNRYNLIGTKCENCGTYYFPPRPVCPPCRRKGVIREYQFEGSGKVVTHTTIYSAPEGFSKMTPYVLAIVELDEGPMLTRRSFAIRLKSRSECALSRFLESSARTDQMA